jgi:CDP-diacylglycerol--glycerol-3-phosphate 3-phosphatidyltransferase
MNLPNALTVLRIFFVPLLLAVMLRRHVELDTGWVLLTRDWLALLIFLCAASTDLLDGYLARRRRQVTTLGKLLDPIADKLLISAAFISLVEMGRVPAWIVVIIVGREFAVSGLRNIAIAEGYAISASDLGKTKMVLQVAAVSLMLLAPGSWLIAELAYIVLCLVVLFAVVSMIDYFRTFWTRLDNSAPARQVPAPPAKILVLPKESKQDLAT